LFIWDFSARCGGILRAASGEISSPNFPRNYPDEAECRWQIIGDKGSKITITFSDFGVSTTDYEVEKKN